MVQAAQAVAQVPPDQLMASLRQTPLTSALDQNLTYLKEIFRSCSDVIYHEFTPASGPRGVLIYVDGMVERDWVNRDILFPLVHGLLPDQPTQVASGVTFHSGGHAATTVGDVILGILSGAVALFLDGSAEALCYRVEGWESRAIAEPITETTIRGPREGFVETLRFNTALLRRKLKSPALKIVHLRIGRLTQTDVAVSYIEGLAVADLVQEVFRRLQAVDIDGILETGYLEELIQDSPFSLFSQVQNTERPDTAAAHLLEGRVIIMVDGTPFVLVVPAMFVQFFHASEDYYERFWVGTLIRNLRFLFMFVALLLPATWIAVTTFHQEMLPTPLLLSIATAREGIPFPAAVEAFLMETSFEILREAGIRLPRPVGQAISIVGALVIGEAAVRARLVSEPMVIIVSLTAIASFAIPKYNGAIAIRLLRFPFMFLASTLGVFGMVAGLMALLLHLCSLRSFGFPYLAPIGPWNWNSLKDVVARAPLFWLRSRPVLVGRRNRIRVGAHQYPKPDR